MTKIFYNIIKITEANTETVFHKFLTANTMSYVTPVYVFCLLFISLCLYWNTRRNNLVYKVLNLAVLSVFVVALWSYLTDVTFIYIVYILTFVSAVVMLFLSVVLMLPSSAVYISKKSSSVFLLIAFAPSNYFFLLLIALWLWQFFSIVAYAKEQHTDKSIIKYIYATWSGYIHKITTTLYKTYSHSNVAYIAETAYQAVAAFSIFTLSIPYGNFNTMRYTSYGISENHISSAFGLENLAAIQHELYVKSPMLVLVCVVGLLVALIGAALLVSTKILNQK